MFHLSSLLGTSRRRYRPVGILSALLLACGVLFSLIGTASAAPVASAATLGTFSPALESGVAYANSHWNWTYYNHTAPYACMTKHNGVCYRSTNVKAAGDTQPWFQCAEFVARSLAAEGFIPGLSATSPESKYDPYKPGNGKTYDLLLITPGLAGPHVYTLADFLLTYGYVKNIHQNLGNTQPGDIVVFRDKNNIPQHTGLVVSVSSGKRTTNNTLLDLHNSARYHASLNSELVLRQASFE